jgi:hypothetical protein
LKEKPPQNRIADGFGPAEDETEKYDQSVADEPVLYGDFNLFYSRARE